MNLNWVLAMIHAIRIVVCRFRFWLTFIDTLRSVAFWHEKFNDVGDEGFCLRESESMNVLLPT